ncbi:MAG: hypothetical protein QNK70_09235 [Crocinitomicaceae bacterium]|tara:strand:- start:183 stop:581 length:399 start_codon:yes stop_codon:yes gene_type:complete
MCRVSDKIKFCTCDPDIEIEDMDNYWVLYRRDTDKNEPVMGSISCLIGLDKKDFKINQKILEKRINEPDAFDIPIILQPGDELHIHLTTPRSNVFAEDDYAFVYQEKWECCDYEWFSYIGMFDVVKQGSVNG